MTAPASLGRQAIAYVFAAGSNSGGIVTPIRTATNTPLPPIKTGANSDTIAITP